MAGSKESLKMAFQFEKATKNTWKYEEVPESGQPPRIGSLYVKKWALGEEPPKRITVTVQSELA
jgi:hypothetical protein